MILGLLKSGMAERAYALLKRITPGYLSGKENDPKNACPPYVYANCYYGADHRYNRFQMEFTWVTGSVAWINNVLLQHMLGARAEFGGLRIDPRIPAEWSECEIDRQFRGATYRIRIHNPDRISGGVCTITLDGEPVEGNLLPIQSDGGVYQVEVTLRAAAEAARSAAAAPRDKASRPRRSMDRRG